LQFFPPPLVQREVDRSKGKKRGWVEEQGREEGGWKATASWKKALRENLPSKPCIPQTTSFPFKKFLNKISY